MPLFFITTATEYNYMQECCHCKKKEAIFMSLFMINIGWNRTCFD